MTREEQVQLLRRSVPEWNQWRKQNPEIVPDLTGADLHGAYLERAHLTGAHLQEACLHGAYLQRAYLHGAYLHGAYLHGAYLHGAHLERANLHGAYLQGAYLHGAYLEGAYLEGANLVGANLEQAYLQEADLERANLEWANLVGANLERANLERANLHGASLEGTILDPKAPANAQVDGFQKANQYSVIGYRTKRSSFVRTRREDGGFQRQVYEPGQVYQAPAFSVCSTDCHPGLYLAPSVQWLQEHGYCGPYVKVRANIQDVHQAGDKWRCRSFTVIEDVE